jgi:hypothetical protein
MGTNSDGKDSRIGTNGNMIGNFCRLPFCGIASCRAAGRKKVIDKHDPVTDETMIADLNQLANKGVGLDLAVVADCYIFLYLRKRADEGMIAYPATV